ncbi:MAG: hypothetical protein AB8H79_08145 [Myxococcota bacterium]
MTLQDRIHATLGLTPSPASADLVDALAVDWAREAGTGDDRADIVDMLVQDLSAAASDVPTEDRMGLLQARVAGREARQLSSATFLLAKQLQQGEVSPDTAVPQATALAAKIAALREHAASHVPQQWRAELQTPLQNALLDAEWVKRGGEGPMSGRLGRFTADQADAPPPDIRP